MASYGLNELLGWRTVLGVVVLRNKSGAQGVCARVVMLCCRGRVYGVAAPRGVRAPSWWAAAVGRRVAVHRPCCGASGRGAGWG